VLAHPHVNPAVRFFADDAGYFAYNLETDRLHELNAAGALIFELCDGFRNFDEIRAIASPALLVDQNGASGNHAVDRFISDALATGLLVASNGTKGAPREFTVEELYNLVAHLSETGQRDSAVRCATRLAQLAPDDSAAWHKLGSIARLAGRRRLAAEAYQKYLATCPEDASIAHLLIALRDETPPPRASDDCVRLTFADFSSHYDTKMCDQLRYEAPERLADLICAELDNASELSILDIGCGTGLSGSALKSRAAHLAGIDLSAEMIERARARGVYDLLEVAEITAWLTSSRSGFDLIVACDCLVYFGDLTLVAQLAAARLKPGGIFAFTVERGEVFPFHLTDSGRFTHHQDHIRATASRSGLQIARLQAGFLRTEAGIDVIGLFALLRKLPQT
jgi:predicted TPR repeat methyltransferase